MKKITQLLFLFTLFSNISFAQTTEVFETETNGTNTFTDNGQGFTITTIETGSGTYDIEPFAGGGWNGTSADNKFIDNSTGVDSGDGSSFSITTTDGTNITVKSFYLFVATKTLGVASTTITITGKKDGVATPIFTFTKSSGFASPVTFSPNNGFTFINLATEGGIDNSTKEIDELIISSTGNADYLALDAFRWDVGVVNTAPIIAATASGQVVNDNTTISPFSTITTTDADGDNLTATITLDNNAKGVLTGASSGSGPYTITSRSPAAMQTALRALSFNPTDNRSATSETTTFTVVINDGTVDATNNTTTVISSAVSPTVTSVNSSTANVTYKIGDNINVNVTFSEAVTVSGTPQITLETGTVDRTINYNGTGSGTNTLQFTYTVQSGDVSADLDYVATNSLTAGTSIRDSGNKDATLTLASPGAANSLGANKAIVIDGLSPTVTSVNSSTANGNYKTGDNVNVNVTFSEAVTVTGTPQLTLETGTTDRTINYNGTGSGTNTLQFTYTVQSGDSSSDLDYVATNSLTAGTSIQDAAGNNATLTLASPGAANSLGANKAIVIDGVLPTVTSVSATTINGNYKVGDNVVVTVAFSEAVTVTGTPQLTLETGTTDRTIDYNGTGSGTTTLQFTYTVQSGDESADLDYVATNSLTAGTSIQDAAGNNATLTLASPGAANSLGANKAIVIDGNSPTLNTNSPLDGDTSIGISSNIVLTFNENIAFGTGNIQVIDVTDASNSFTIDAASPGAQATINGAVLTINPNSDMDFSSNYAIQIASTAIDDASGNSFAGIISNTILDFTTEATSGTGTHLHFDGTNDVVDLGSSLNTILDDINTFTIEARVRPSTTSGNGVIVGNYDYPTTSLGMQFLLRRDGSNYTFWIDHGTGFKNVTATGAVTINTWQHVAGVWDGTSLKIYVDGVLINTVAEAGASFKTLTTTKVVIGGNAHNENFTGEIDEVRIWNKVRTIGEISANKDSEISNTETGLLAYYQFNQGTGAANNSGITKLTDNSVNNNTGTLTNFTLSGTTSNWISSFPKVASISATTADGSYKIGDAITITVTFDKNVTVIGTPQLTLETGTTDRTIDYNGTGSGTTTLQFGYNIQGGDTSADLDYVATNSLTAGTSIKDASGNNAILTLPSPGAANSLGANKAILVDGNIPTLSSSTPADNATNIATNANIVLTFSENISKGTGNIVIKKTTDNTTFATIDVTSGNVTVSSTQATINPSTDLDLSTEYYVQIDNTAFKDAVNNNYAGIFITTVLSFTTEANQTNSFAVASGNWSVPSNWSLGRLPIITDNVNVGTNTINLDVSNVEVNDLSISIGGAFNILSNRSITINGNLNHNGTLNILSNASANGSLILKGNHTGISNVDYHRYLSTNWHLISSPVNGKNISDFSGNVNTNGNKYAIAPYVNNVVSASRWNYYTGATGAGTGANPLTTAGTFTKAKGYSIQKSTGGTLNFSGALNTNNAGESIAITDGGDNPAGNRWNLIGSPYTAALKGGNSTPANQTNTFLRVNIDAGNLDPLKAGVYLWNGSAPYVVKSVDDDFFIAPGQAFFVHAKDGGGTSASFTEAMQTHQTGNIFLKNAKSYPEIIVNLSNGKSNILTKVRYIEGKTTGLDIGSDVGTFTGESSNFNVFSHLLSNSEGIDFAIQALPNNNYENMIIPIGVVAESGKEITFSTTMNNFPDGLKVFIEDKKYNTFKRIDETNSNYKITLDSAQNGIGRFYLHTTSSALSLDTSVSLDNVSIYKVNNSTLRIAGLSQEKTQISIFNLLGKRVFNSSFIANSVKDINLPNLSNGVYLVQLKTKSSQLNKKIILE